MGENKIIVEQLGYQYLDQFKDYANQAGIAIAEADVMAYVSEHQVYVAVDDGVIVGSLIIDGNQCSYVGEVDQIVYSEVLRNHGISI